MSPRILHTNKGSEATVSHVPDWNWVFGVLLVFFAGRSLATDAGTQPSLEEFRRLCAEEPDSQPRYFQAGTFSKDPKDDKRHNCIRSRFLAAMREPVLWPPQAGTETYRLLWLRVFYHPVAVRIERRGENYILVAKEADGSSYQPGNLVVDQVRKLSAAQWSRILKLVQTARFWSLPSAEPDTSLVKVTDNVVEILAEPTEWILEGVKQGRHHTIAAYTPKKSTTYSAYKELCIYLLSISGLPAE